MADVTLRVNEWPGRGDPVLLLHATGFHSRCWDHIARQLPDVHLYAVDLRYHGGSDFHGDVDWQMMARDIAQLVVTLDLNRVVGVGHSIGGYLAAYAAALQLPRFKQLLLIDPVVLPRESYSRDFASIGAIDPADNPVSKRKNLWQNSEEMYQRFCTREPFSRWQDQVLRDYCEYALKEVPGESAFQLACDPLHESAIYINQRGNDAIYDLLPQLTLPVTVLRALADPKPTRSLSSSPTWPGLVDMLPDARELYLPELSHFIPMEDPELVAGLIREAVSSD